MAPHTTSIPPNAEKWLFAEDLVNYVMAHCCRATGYENLKRAEEFRDYVFNGFCCTVKAGIDILYKSQKSVVQGDYADLKKRSKVTTQSLLDYAKDHRDYYFAEGFEGDYFLKYSIRLALLAYHFYEDGVEEAPVMAGYAILRGFPVGLPSALVWKTVYFAALRYSNLATVSGSVRDNPYADRKGVPLVQTKTVGQ